MDHSLSILVRLGAALALGTGLLGPVSSYAAEGSASIARWVAGAAAVTPDGPGACECCSRAGDTGAELASPSCEYLCSSQPGRNRAAAGLGAWTAFPPSFRPANFSSRS